MFKAITSEITFEETGKEIIPGIEFNDTSSYNLYQSNGHWKVHLEITDYMNVMEH